MSCGLAQALCTVYKEEPKKHNVWTLERTTREQLGPIVWSVLIGQVDENNIYVLWRLHLNTSILFLVFLGT